MIRWLFVAAILLMSFGASATSPTPAKTAGGSCNSATASGNATACNAGASSVYTFTYAALAANNGVLIYLGTGSALSSATCVLTAPGWTFTAVGTSIGANGTGWAALFKAYAPNTTSVTFTATWTTSAGNLGSFASGLIEEWSGVDQTNFVDATGVLNHGAAGCSVTVTPVTADDGIVGMCNDGPTAVGATYTKGADDLNSDWSEHKTITGGVGVAQTVDFSPLTGAANEIAIAIKGVASGPPGPLTTTIRGTTPLILRAKGTVQ